VIVAPPKAPLRDAPLPRRTRTIVNVEKQRQIDDLSSAMGYPRRTFEAMDSQHVFIVGTDGVLRFEQGPFNSGGVEAGKSAVASEIVDRNVVTFEAGSEREVLVLKADGALLIETAPFGLAADGRCAEGFVWREAFPNDHACVSPSTRAQAAADNLAGPSRIFPIGPPIVICLPGYVWREANADDHVCVAPSTRMETARDNASSPSHLAAVSQLKFLGWPVSGFNMMGNRDVMVLDPYAKLWLAKPPLARSAKPAEIAENVRAFQAIDPQRTLVLTTDDQLQVYPLQAGRAATTCKNIWASSRLPTERSSPSNRMIPCGENYQGNRSTAMCGRCRRSMLRPSLSSNTMERCRSEGQRTLTS
jgi:hypothetical protein